MSLRTKCPHCERDAVFVAEALGKNVRCKGCGKPFVVTATAAAIAAGRTTKPTDKPGLDPETRAAVRAGNPTAVKTHASPLSHADDSDDGRPQQSVARKPQADMTLWIGLSAIGIVTIVASVLTFVLITGRQPTIAHVPPAPPQIAKAAIVEQSVVRQPKADPPAPPKVEAKIEPAPKADPQPQPEQAKLAPPQPKKVEAPPNLYGTQGNFACAPAELAPHTLMRARSEDSFYRIGNPRVAANAGNPRGTLLVAFQTVQRRQFAATHLLIRYANDRLESVAMGPIVEKDQGTIQVNKDPASGAQFPEAIECALIRVDTTFGNPPGVFMVSDLARMGDVGERMRPRNWTPEEIARFAKESPPGLREK
jgi:hypothetical protein